MPFSDTTSAPRIVDGGHADPQTINYPLLGRAWSRVVTTLRLRHTWLTQAAADTIATAKNAETGKTASYSRMSPIGAYQVNVTEITEGAWSEDT
jgi:hypothetical protein